MSRGQELSQDQQDQIVMELAVGVETLSEEEREELDDQLDDEHKMEVRDNVAEFANDAVGDENWER